MIYINESSFFDAAGIGVYRKMMAQCRTFEKEFGTTYCTTRHGGIAYLLHQDEVVEKKPTLSKMDFYECAKEWIKKYEERNVYIRYNLGNKWLVEFADWLSKQKIKSLVEIHTFDNINEFKNSGLRIEDKYYGDMLCRYYEYCAGYDDRKEYRGMKVIPLVNGVDLEKNPLSKTTQTTETYKDACTMIIVASLGIWSGYERIIEGIYEYYKKGGTRDISLNILGNGTEYSYYDELIRKYKLQDRIHLVGAVRSEHELNKYYDITDVAVGVLGAYKRDSNEKGSSIKMREYCARGIPIIYGYDDVGFSGKEEYVKRFPNDASTIDITEVLRLHDKVMLHRKEYASEMRSYIDNNYTWDRVMKPVCDYYKN